MDTRVVSAHVPQNLAERVDEAAERLERSRGWVIKQALSDWLALEEERHRMTLEGLADVKAGRVVEHAQVRAWLQSLGTKNQLPEPKP